MGGGKEGESFGIFIQEMVVFIGCVKYCASDGQGVKSVFRVLFTGLGLSLGYR